MGSSASAEDVPESYRQWITSLSEMSESGAVEAVQQALTAATSPLPHPQLLTYLSKMPESEALEVVRQALIAFTKPDPYQQWLKSLSELPEPEAEEALRQALSKGTDAITFTRPDVVEHLEHIHHYFGCPRDHPCDHNREPGAQPWEEIFLISVDKIKKTVDDCKPCIVHNWATFACVVFKQHDLLQERWLKKTVKQRKALLLEAWKDLPTTHRPDIDASIVRGCPHQRGASTLASYAFPYLNLEDLSHPKSLLLLLHTRASKYPWTFAKSYLEFAPMIKVRPKALPPTTHTMTLESADWGEMKEWKDEAEAQQSIIDGDSVHPVHGFQTLHMAEFLNKFLRSCVELLLTKEEIAAAHVLTDEEPACCDGTSGIHGRELHSYNCKGAVLDWEIKIPDDPGEHFTSLDIIAREAPYRQPKQLNLEHLKALVSAHKDAAEEHIWALREDPGYFVHVAKDMKDHRYETLRGSHCGKVHYSDDDIWEKVLMKVISDAYIEFHTWDEMYSRISQLHHLSLEHTDAEQMYTHVSDAFFHQLVEMWFFLDATKIDMIDQMRFALPATPEIRHYFALSCDHYCNKDYLKIIAKLPKSRDKDLEHMLKLYEYLWDPPMRNTLPVHALVDSIGHIVQTNSRAWALTTPHIASLLSQLSIVSECLQQLSTFQPWSTQIQSTVKKNQTSLFINYARGLSMWNPILRTSFKDTDLVNLGKPDVKFRYPVNKRRSRQNVQTLRSAEDALDAFWKAADDHFVQQAGFTPHHLVAHLIKERLLERTPPWVEPEESASSLAKPPVEYIYQPFSSANHDPSKQITGVFDRLSLSDPTKPKSRGTTTTPTKTLEVHQPEPSDSDTQRTYHLDIRAHKVSIALFHSPLSRSVPGEVLWTDFLHFMSSTGFTAQKLQGSAWQFSPPKEWIVERPIQLHEPHPGNRLPFTWARRFGRRLARVYGLEGMMFTLE